MSDGIKRRDFLRVVGAGGAGATMFGCSTKEVEKLLPYVVPPEDITPGVATWYTSVCGECAAECGIWVKTREGRVIKVEGNPSHPISEGALCSRGHATLQGLYNPDRLKSPMVRDGSSFRSATWEEAETMLADRLQAAGAATLVMNGHTGPAMTDLLDNFVSLLGGTRVEHDALAEASLSEAVRVAFGRPGIPTYDFSQARVVYSFGADFLETWLSPVEFGRGFAAMSAADELGSKGRFVFIGPRLSLTGQNADEWVPIVPGSEGRVALAMANVIAGRRGGAGPYQGILDAHDPDTVASDAGISAETIRDLATRFMDEGPGLAVGPGVAGQHRGATESNLAVLVLNAVAGNMGRSVQIQNANLSWGSGSFQDVQDAIESMSSGAVQAALILGTNPAYSLPSAAGFSEAFRNVGFKAVFAQSMDETAQMADLVLPDRHPLESWGDSHPRDGVYALRQPAMRAVPLFDSKQAGDVFLSVSTRMGNALGPATFHEHLRGRWQRVHQLAGGGEDFETFWRRALHDGVVTVPRAAQAADQPLRAPDTALSFEMPTLEGSGAFALLVYPSTRFGDGSLSNSPWMQELPDPVSKLAWHSWLEMHPAAAETNGLRDGDVVRVTSSQGSLDLPLWTYPGIREDTVAIAMGGGHESYGRFADGNGVNAMDLLPAEAEQPSGALVHLASRVSVTATGERRPLATVVGSRSQSERGIAPAVALAELNSTEEHEEEVHEGLQELQEGGGFIPVPTEGAPGDFPLPGAQYGEYANPEDKPRWAMTIDLEKCTGCSACITACQAENNVPWVGEDQVVMGREMHWVRLEAYYETVDASHPGPVDIRHLPMICQHCGNAPCEPVCPVFAAYHTPEGLNAQVYNRCVGTRYCANNCPYKVRVFNWFTYSDVPEPMNWQYNPDVTVRESGVMEKCSFCVQRIRQAQNRAALEGNRDVADGEVVPACQQSCPAQAIVFGNVRDPRSRVAQSSQSRRAYRVLDELINTQPAVTYLKKVTFHEVESGEH